MENREELTGRRVYRDEGCGIIAAGFLHRHFFRGSSSSRRAGLRLPPLPTRPDITEKAVHGDPRRDILPRLCFSRAYVFDNVFVPLRPHFLASCTCESICGLELRNITTPPLSGKSAPPRPDAAQRLSWRNTAFRPAYTVRPPSLNGYRTTAALSGSGMTPHLTAAIPQRVSAYTTRVSVPKSKPISTSRISYAATLFVSGVVAPRMTAAVPQRVSACVTRRHPRLLSVRTARPAYASQTPPNQAAPP